LESAARLIDNAFTRVGNVLEGQQKVGFDNWDQIKENNTQDFLNRVYSAQGAEGFKALQDSGELDRMLAANGAQIDRAAARSAMDGRLPTLQQRDRQGWEYDNAALDQREAPVVDQIKGLIAQGKLEEAKPLIGGLSTRNQAGMFTSLDARTQLELSRDRDAERFGWDKADEAQKVITRPLAVQGLQSNLKNDQAQRRYTSALTKKALKETEYVGSNTGSGKGTNAIDAAYNEFIKNTPLDQGSIDTTEGKKALYAGLKTIGVSDKAQSDILYNLDKYYKEGVTVGTDKQGNPIRVPLPVSVVLDAVQGSSDNPLAFGWSRRGDDVANLLDKRFGIDSDGKQVEGVFRDVELIKVLRAAANMRNERDGRLAGGAVAPFRTNPNNKPPARAPMNFDRSGDYPFDPFSLNPQDDPEFFLKPVTPPKR
jgi:hypothetical protein